MQKDALIAHRLGATEAQARALQWRYYTQVYPNMPLDYKAVGCTIS
jgi:hypothetical protein